MVGNNTEAEIRINLALSFIIQALRHPTGTQQTSCIKIAIEYLQEAQALPETP